jgi:hypothetical protein
MISAMLPSPHSQTTCRACSRAHGTALGNGRRRTPGPGTGQVAARMPGRPRPADAPRSEVTAWPMTTAYRCAGPAGMLPRGSARTVHLPA